MSDEWTFDTERYKGHTAGPWRLYTQMDGSLGVWNGGTGIAKVAGHAEIHGDEIAANAHLIADAPRLLQEVERLRALIEQDKTTKYMLDAKRILDGGKRRP